MSFLLGETGLAVPTSPSSVVDVMPSVYFEGQFLRLLMCLERNLNYSWWGKLDWLS